MNCQDIAEILDDGDGQSLSAAERRALEVHVAGCAECRAAFAAHEAMGAMVVPAMSPRLAELCRSAIVVQSASRTRRAGGRPFVVVGLLVAGAAAATFLGLTVIDGPVRNPQLPEVSVSAPAASAAATEPTVTTFPETVEATAASDEPAGVAPGSTGFTVGVAPLKQLSTDSGVIQLSETVYRAFLDELRKIPNLELVMLAPGEFEANDFRSSIAWWMEGAEPAVATPVQAPSSGSFAVAGPPGGVIDPDSVTAANITNLIDPDAAGTNTGEARTLVLGDSSRFVASNSNGTVDMNMIPTALVGRIETVTGGASATYGADAMAGVVNVILDNNIQGVRVDLSYVTTDEAHSATLPPNPLPYEYMLQATSGNPGPGSAWQFQVSGLSRGGMTFSAVVGTSTDGPVVSGELLEPVISGLQDQLFPVDETTLAAIEQRVLDTRLPPVDRMREFGRLTRMSERSGSVQISDAAALAGVEIVMSVDNDWERETLLASLRGVDNAVVVQPLSNILRNDNNEATRLQAALALTAFDQDPLARAALETAANIDPSAEVRQNARWGLLDTAGRRNLIIATLLDTRLSDAERLEPLLFEPDWANELPVDLGSAVDATVVNELTALLRREERVDTRVNIVGRFTASSNPALTPMLIERLAEDDSLIVRRLAVEALGRRRDEPGVKSAIERAAAEDPSPVVRASAARSLEAGN
jgi:hypothetical protein